MVIAVDTQELFFFVTRRAVEAEPFPYHRLTAESAG